MEMGKQWFKPIEEQKPYFNSDSGRMEINVGFGKYKRNMYYSRYLMEKKLGRRLETWEHVHHIDEDITNDDPDNLEIRHRDIHALFHVLGSSKPKQRKLTQEQVDYYRKEFDEYRIALSTIMSILKISKSTAHRIFSQGLGY